MTIKEIEYIKVLYVEKEENNVDVDFNNTNKQVDHAWVNVTEINFEHTDEIDNMIKALEALKKETLLVKEDYKQASKKYQEETDKGNTGIGVSGYLKRGVHIANIKTITSSGSYLLLMCEEKENSQKCKELKDEINEAFKRK